jgi:hypothetical protein
LSRRKAAEKYLASKLNCFKHENMTTSIATDVQTAMRKQHKKAINYQICENQRLEDRLNLPNICLIEI